jgi:FAD:protein FMN transferase
VTLAPLDRSEEASASLAVMGTHARVVVYGLDAVALADVAVLRLAELEVRWSRFDERSEISLLNRHAGHAVAVSPDTMQLVIAALAGWERTSGAFDPTVLGHIVALGYDRSFCDIPSGRAAGVVTTGAADAVTVNAAGIVVDAHGLTVTLPVGAGFDPGGIGKGLAADIVASELLAAGAVGACVDVGGDVRVAGVPPDGAPWAIVLEKFDGLPTDRIVRLRDGGIATSSPLLRCWQRGGTTHHHLIDPRSGSSVVTPIVSVTVIAAKAWQAEVLTKAVFVCGYKDGLALVDALGASARVVLADGAVHVSDEWHRYH